ncbi:MAG: hypothetical protein IJ680_06025 [Paludibacteraceae bacterium]|nr:hypothetical protein [Paludibacteraceae bacterium]
MKHRQILISMILCCLTTACVVDEPDIDTISIERSWLTGQWQLTRKVIDYNIIAAGITVKSEKIDDSFSVGHRDTFDLRMDNTFIVNTDTAGTWDADEQYLQLNITNPAVDYYQDLQTLHLGTNLRCKVTAQDSSHIVLYYFGQKNIIVGNLNGQLWFYLER